MNKDKIIQSEITLGSTIEDIGILSPCKIIFNDIVLYNDYDSEKVIDTWEDGTKVYGEIYPSRIVVPDRIEKFKYSIVTHIDIEIVMHHHSIVTMQGEYREM